MTPEFDTALDLPAEEIDDYERGLLDDIRRHGWRSTHVTDDPVFTYSTGFWLSHGQPEVLVFDFPATLAHDVLGAMVRRWREGEVFATGAPVNGILSGEAVWLEPMSDAAARTYLRSTVWFYRDMAPPCLQLIWPDKAGLFPWQAGFDSRMAGLQPDLSRGGWPRP